jgi:3-methylcrotonyl-CoA carboxylase alpha subunit
MTFAFELLRARHSVAPSYADRDGALELVIDDTPTAARLHTGDGAGAYELEIDAVRERVRVAHDGDRIFVHLRGRAFEVRVVDPLTLARGEARAQRGEEVLLAPMPGVVVEVNVREGDAVAAGQTLLVIESMKLQTAIAAEIAGRVSALPVARGDGFEQGAVLARIEPPAADDAEPRSAGPQQAVR